MEELIKKIFKEFCNKTRRSGGVLVTGSISEWHKFLAKRLEDELNTVKQLSDTVKGISNNNFTVK